MRRGSLLLGLTLLVAMTAWEMYDFCVTNAGLRYYATEPRRLLYAGFLGLAGGLMALGVSRLSPASQRALKLAVLGGFGLLLVMGLVLLASLLTWAAPLVSEAGMWGWVAVLFLSFTVIIVLVGLEFRQVWRSPGGLSKR